jgi:hypothetical protein
VPCILSFMFHSSKTFSPDYTLVFAQLPEVPPLDVADLLPEKILAHRLVKKGNVAVTQILVQWSSAEEVPDGINLGTA